MSLHSHFHRHIAKHLVRHHHHVYHVYHALIHHLNTIEHTLLCIVLAVGFVTTSSLRAGTSKPILTVNTSLIYPVRQVTTLPCRAQLKTWEELPESCKVSLPHITNAAYNSFASTQIDKDTPLTSVYTVLR